MKQSTYLRRLGLLRVCFIAALKGAEAYMSLRHGTEASLPYRWLGHYLQGSGADMHVPAEVMKHATLALQRAVRRDSYGSMKELKELSWSEGKKALYGKKFCVCHSTLYEGSGFAGRPILFYLLGGFTFKVERITRKGATIVSGVDHYDWHGTIGRDGKPHYFCSPLGNAKLLKSVCRFLDAFTGNKSLFTDNCWPDNKGEAGISNQLWEEFKLVGANEFDTYFRAEVKLGYHFRK